MNNTERIEMIAPKRCEIGEGAFHKTGEIAKAFGVKFAVIIGGNSIISNGALARLEDDLKQQDVDYIVCENITEEPNCEIVDSVTQFARRAFCGGVIAAGGGSVLDVGKCVAAMINNSGSVRDYLEGLAHKKILTGLPAVQISIPTTSGTGAEATNNAVLVDRDAGWKRSLRAQNLAPDVAIVDPALVVGLPKEQTAYSGMDAIAQLMEAYTTRTANEISDEYALRGLKHANALEKAVLNGHDMQARLDMAKASFYSGIAISNSGVTAAHALASGFGGALGIGHGEAVAILLPHVMEMNREAMPDRFEHIYEALTGERTEDQGRSTVNYIKALCERIGIPQDFRAYSITNADIDKIMQGKSNSSLAKNPVEQTEQQWREFVERLCAL